jgi:hypothetical protein
MRRKHLSKSKSRRLFKKKSGHHPKNTRRTLKRGGIRL